MNRWIPSIFFSRHQTCVSKTLESSNFQLPKKKGSFGEERVTEEVVEERGWRGCVRGDVEIETRKNKMRSEELPLVLSLMLSHSLSLSGTHESTRLTTSVHISPHKITLQDVALVLAARLCATLRGMGTGQGARSG